MLFLLVCSPQLSSVTSSLTEQILSHLFSQVLYCTKILSHLFQHVYAEHIFLSFSFSVYSLHCACCSKAVFLLTARAFLIHISRQISLLSQTDSISISFYFSGLSIAWYFPVCSFFCSCLNAKKLFVVCPSVFREALKNKIHYCCDHFFYNYYE